MFFIDKQPYIQGIKFLLWTFCTLSEMIYFQDFRTFSVVWWINLSSICLSIFVWMNQSAIYQTEAGIFVTCQSLTLPSLCCFVSLLTVRQKPKNVFKIFSKESEQQKAGCRRVDGERSIWLAICNLAGTKRPHLQLVSSVCKSRGSCPSRHLAQSRWPLTTSWQLWRERRNKWKSKKAYKQEWVKCLYACWHGDMILNQAEWLLVTVCGNIKQR